MSDLRTAAQQALEALEGGADSWQLVGPAIDALRAALAEPVQEPVAMLWQHRETGRTRVLMPNERTATDVAAAWDVVGPLYLAPPQRPVEPVQEPVAWRFQSSVGGWAYGSQPPVGSKYPVFPLYAAPPQRKPLTDEEIADIYIKWDATPGVSMADFARAIERAHGIV